ncbi:MAG: hypothetical protein V4793_00530 [Paraburkholderia tropica]
MDRELKPESRVQTVIPRRAEKAVKAAAAKIVAAAGANPCAASMIAHE